MEIVSIGTQQPTYIETINKKNIEDQDKRTAENLANAKKWQNQLENIREMVSGYNISKLPLAQNVVGGTVDLSA